MTSPIPLRERLAAAKLAGTSRDSAGFGYVFRTNEQAAEQAAWVVAVWLREIAIRVEERDSFSALLALADAIDKELNP